MASIKKRKTKNGQTRYKVEINLRGYAPQYSTFNTLADARRWATGTEAALREGRYFKPTASDQKTFAELADRYIQEVLPVKPKIKYDQTYQLRWWIDEIGHYFLDDLTPAILAKARDKLSKTTGGHRKKKSSATVNRYLAALTAALNHGVREWNWLKESPAKGLRKCKEPRGRVRYLSDDERQRLFQACLESSNENLYTIVVLALSTGMRKGEIMGLTWENIDLKRGFVYLEDTKNGERRAVPLVGKALKLIEDLSKRQGKLFPAKSIRTAWEKALERAQISDFRFHDLRHSAASYLAMNKASLLEIAEILGHKTLSMTKRYSHLSNAHTRSVVEKMNEKILE